MITTVAVALAVVDAVCFGVAAVLQHRGVGRTLESRPAGARKVLDLAAFGRLLSHPVWLAGSAFLILGTTMHVIALFLAPVSLIQPIGVLAIPVAVFLTAQHARRPIGPGVIRGIALCVAGTASFVWLAAGRVTSTPITARDLGIATAVMAVVVLALVLAAVPGSRWLRCLAYASAGAVAFGFVSALMRALSQHLDGHVGRILDPIALGLLICLLTAVAVGGWCVQHAYASGPPAVVMACLTVIDPLVAVLLGVVLLGEGAAIGPGTGAAMVGAGLVAALGVATLSSHHPGAQPRSAIDSGGARDIGSISTEQSLPERSARHEDHARR